MIIYKTTNLINGKFYIGKDSHNNPDYYGSGFLLKKAIAKYGKENFKKEIIDTADNMNELNEKEKYWIKETKAQEYGYNITSGGDGGDTITNHPNRENIIKQMSLSMQGKNTGPRSEETKRKLSEWRTGKTFEDIMNKETADKERKRLSKKWKENNPNNYRDLSGENNPMYGKKHRKETIDKMKKAAEGRQSPTKGKFKKFLFYKDNILIHEAKGQQAAIKYCKENKLPYSILVKRFEKWNNYKCITKK